MQFEPRGGVHEFGERQRVTLGETEIRERQDLLVDRIGPLCLDAALGHPR